MGEMRRKPAELPSARPTERPCCAPCFRTRLLAGILRYGGGAEEGTEGARIDTVGSRLALAAPMACSTRAGAEGDTRGWCEVTPGRPPRSPRRESQQKTSRASIRAQQGGLPCPRPWNRLISSDSVLWRGCGRGHERA